MKENQSGTELHAFRVEWLSTYLRVIECDCIEARAAEELKVNAGTVNRHIGKLETWLQRPLFTNDYPKQLTQFGKVFENTAQALLKELEKAQQLPSQPQSKKPVSVADIDMSQYRAKSKGND